LQELAHDKDCHFDPRELRDLLQTWLKDNPSGNASKADVVSFLTTSSSANDKELLERVVNAFDEDHNGQIDFREAILGLSILLRGGHQEKVCFLFHALDTDNTNSLSKSELKDALQSQMRMLQGRTAAPQRASVTVDDIFAKGDLDGDGVLSLDEFMKLVESQPSLRQHFTIADEVCRFNAPDTSAKKRVEALQVLAQALDLSPGPTHAASLKPETAAHILSSVPGLSPVAIGEFLGGKDTDGFIKICSNMFFTSLQLEVTTLDEALRRMSQKLCLPRESQQIDRIVQAFAETYCSANPKSFPDEDSAYLTAFAIVMLNADAHSATVKKKMTKEEFIRNCSLATPEVKTDVLDGIYDRVTVDEIILSAANNSSGGVATLLSTLGSTELSTVLASMKDDRC
jgi:Ca2+-binding EF-hand superfamily protein